MVTAWRSLIEVTLQKNAFEAIATSSIKLARHIPEDELTMDLQVAEAILEFGDDLRQAAEAVAHPSGWAEGALPVPRAPTV